MAETCADKGHACPEADSECDDFPGRTRQLVRKAGFVHMAGIALYVDMNSAMRGRGAGSRKLQASVTLATDSGWMTANPETIRGQRSGSGKSAKWTIQFGRRLLRRSHSVPVDRKRGRITFLDREARTGAAKVVSADVGKLSGCLGFIPETSAEF